MLGQKPEELGVHKTQSQPGLQPVIQTLARLRQARHKFSASLGHREILSQKMIEKNK